MRYLVFLVVAISVFGVAPLSQRSAAQSDPTLSESMRTLVEEELVDSPIDSSRVQRIDGWIQSTGIIEWMGPLAPVALSPFFGVTCLSGLSLWGPDWVADNALIGTSSVLRSRMLFVIFLALTVLTSLPRFTKVSKPMAQAVDRLEAYSVIVILLAVKFAAAYESPGDPATAMIHPTTIHLGVISVTIDTLLAIAMIINILVINSVKFFFEFMVWLTPIPFLDAVFEVCNKTICAALVAVYAFSPTIATIINLCVLFAALVVFRWVNRRVRFYRTMLLDPVLAWAWRPYGQVTVPELIVFPKEAIGPFPAKSRVRLLGSDTGDGGWILEEASWWRPDRQFVIPADTSARVTLGWVMNSIEFIEPDGKTFYVSFSRRYEGDQLREIIEDLRMRVSESEVQSDEVQRMHEFA